MPALRVQIPQVTELEERGGSQLESSSGFGRWVLPWVGGWQRLWTNSADASFLGGPAADKFGFYKEISHRQFVYGPGDGGAVEEYLFECPGGEKSRRAAALRPSGAAS